MLDDTAPAILDRTEPTRRLDHGPHHGPHRRPLRPSAHGASAYRPALRVERPRLLTILDEPKPVTVLRAPTGFGKTTLLRQWTETRPGVQWLGPPPDAASWWSSIVDALTATAGTTADATPGPGSPRAVAERLLAATGPVALVVDGIDALTAHPPGDLLGLLAADRGLRLVLAGRGNRWFPGDLLTDVEASVIGADRLLFTGEETADLLAQTLPHLPSRTTFWADQVYRGTGGWPGITATVARRMAAATPDPVELSAVATRAATELVRHRLMPELERSGGVDLALTTAVGGRFSAELAAAVTGRHDAGAALDEMVGDGLLIAESVGGQTIYRWPDAAKAVLLAESNFRDPTRVAALHVAWGRACLQDGRPQEAVRHAVAGRDWRLLVRIIDSAWRPLLHDDTRVIRDALMAAPQESLAGSPRALALREMLLFTPGVTPVGTIGLATGTAPGDQSHPLPSLPDSIAGLARLATCDRLAEVFDAGLLVLAAHRRRGRHAAALEHARRLLGVAVAAQATRPVVVAPHRPTVELALGGELLLTGDFPAAIPTLESAYRLGTAAPGASAQCAATGASSLLAMLHAVLGEVSAARRWSARLAAIIAVQAEPARPTAHLHVAAAVTDLLVAVDESDDAAADAASDRLAVLDCASWWLDLWAFACFAQARYALHRGDVCAGLTRIARARATHGHDLGDGGIAEPLLAAAEADLLIAAGRANQAQCCLRRARPHTRLQVPAARLALLAGDTATAARLASDQAWESAAGTRERVEMGVILAVAADRLGEPGRAATALSRATRAAREAGLRAAWRAVPQGMLDDLARRAPAPLGAPPAGTADVYPPALVLVDLTDGEVRVLRELVAGATLEGVAAALTVSYNTVKTHVASIYRKLSVGSRQAAIAEARRLGLLEPASG